MFHSLLHGHHLKQVYGLICPFKKARSLYSHASALFLISVYLITVSRYCSCMLYITSVQMHTKAIFSIYKWTDTAQLSAGDFSIWHIQCTWWDISFTDIFRVVCTWTNKLISLGQKKVVTDLRYVYEAIQDSVLDLYSTLQHTIMIISLQK